MDTLSLEMVFSPTTNRATSRRTHVQERGGCPRQLKGAGDTTVRPHQPHSSWAGSRRGGFQGSLVHGVLYLYLTNLA